MRAHLGSLAVQVKYATEKQKLNCSNELYKSCPSEYTNQTHINVLKSC